MSVSGAAAKAPLGGQESDYPLVMTNSLLWQMMKLDGNGPFIDVLQILFMGHDEDNACLLFQWKIH